MTWSWNSLPLGSLASGLLVAALSSMLWPTALAAEPEPVPIIDLHVDLSYQHTYKGKSFGRGTGDYVAATLRRAGVRGVVLPLYVPEHARPHGRTLAQLETSYGRVFEQLLKTQPYSLPGCGVHRAGGEERDVETWLSFEGAAPVPPTEEELRRWSIRGVRLYGLVHSVHNGLASSSGKPVGSRGGLTEAGRSFVQAVYRVGGVVDVSHASDEATNGVLDLAEKLGRPVVASHSNARALAPHPRNLTDEQIRRIARSGGVIGVNFHQPYLAASGHADLSDVVEQMTYLARTGGDSVVAIGSDYEGGIRPVSELSDARQFQVLARALREAGFDEDRLRAFLAGNARRVLCSF